MSVLPLHKPYEMGVVVNIIKVSEADERVTAAQTPRDGRRGLSYQGMWWWWACYHSTSPTRWASWSKLSRWKIISKHEKLAQ